VADSGGALSGWSAKRPFRKERIDDAFLKDNSNVSRPVFWMVIATRRSRGIEVLRTSDAPQTGDWLAAEGQNLIARFDACKPAGGLFVDSRDEHSPTRSS